MSTKLVVGKDKEVGAWLFEQVGAEPRDFDMAVGIADEEGNLMGGFMFTDYDGDTIEAHFYGPGTMTRRAVSALFRIARDGFNARLVIAHANKESIARGLKKIGATFVGETDNTGGRFGEFHFNRPTIERWAAMRG